MTAYGPVGVGEAGIVVAVGLDVVTGTIVGDGVSVTGMGNAVGEGVAEEEPPVGEDGLGVGEGSWTAPSGDGVIVTKCSVGGVGVGEGDPQQPLTRRVKISPRPTYLTGWLIVNICHIRRNCQLVKGDT
jgi:hypothetical protein